MTTNEELTQQWQVTCICGWQVRGRKRDVVSSVQAHSLSAHNVQKATEEDIMKLASLIGS